jgi:hypothetical protein
VFFELPNKSIKLGSFLVTYRIINIYKTYQLLQTYQVEGLVSVVRVFLQGSDVTSLVTKFNYY